MMDGNSSSFGANSGGGGGRVGTTNASAGNQAHLFNLVN